MAKSPTQLLENETTIRFDETGSPAVLWTASIPVRNEWRAAGFPVLVVGGGWGCRVPVDRITYKVMKPVGK